MTTVGRPRILFYFPVRSPWFPRLSSPKAWPPPIPLVGWKSAKRATAASKGEYSYCKNLAKWCERRVGKNGFLWQGVVARKPANPPPMCALMVNLTTGRRWLPSCLNCGRRYSEPLVLTWVVAIIDTPRPQGAGILGSTR